MKKEAIHIDEIQMIETNILNETHNTYTLFYREPKLNC